LALTPLRGIQHDWDQETCATELAATYIALVATELAAACVAGIMPERPMCYFWSDWSVAAFEADMQMFPCGLQVAFVQLVEQKARWQEVSDELCRHSGRTSPAPLALSVSAWYLRDTNLPARRAVRVVGRQ